jgi:hypothetical protein
MIDLAICLGLCDKGCYRVKFHFRASQFEAEARKYQAELTTTQEHRNLQVDFILLISFTLSFTKYNCHRKSTDASTTLAIALDM